MFVAAVTSNLHQVTTVTNRGMEIIQLLFKKKCIVFKVKLEASLEVNHLKIKHQEKTE